MLPRRATPEERNPWRWYLTLGRWAFGWTRPRYVYIAGHRRVVARLWRRVAAPPPPPAR